MDKKPLLKMSVEKYREWYKQELKVSDTWVRDQKDKLALIEIERPQVELDDLS